MRASSRVPNSRAVDIQGACVSGLELERLGLKLMVEANRREAPAFLELIRAERLPKCEDDRSSLLPERTRLAEARL
jgi:hypothetical protein